MLCSNHSLFLDEYYCGRTHEIVSSIISLAYNLRFSIDCSHKTKPRVIIFCSRPKDDLGVEACFYTSTRYSEYEQNVTTVRDIGAVTVGREGLVTGNNQDSVSKIN